VEERKGRKLGGLRYVAIAYPTFFTHPDHNPTPHRHRRPTLTSLPHR
jgi:hypothetical protein